MFILCHPPGRGIISPPSSRLGIVVIMFKLMGYLYSPNLEWESSASSSENLTPAERELVKMPLPGIRLVGYRYWSASRLRELGMDNIGVLMPIVDAHPHLRQLAHQLATNLKKTMRLTLRNVLRPARILPPIHVEYLRSGGAKILILMSLTASFCTSDSNRSPKPLVKVLPPERTMLLYRDLRRSRSVRLMASTTI